MFANLENKVAPVTGAGRGIGKPIHPKNLWMEQDPLRHAEVDEIYRRNIASLVERGTVIAATRPRPAVCRNHPPPV